MSQFMTTQIEQAFNRQAILGLELIDGVTLEPVYRGIRVQAKGLTNEPQVSRSGVFYWLGIRANQVIPTIVIDPGQRPYEGQTIGPITLNELGSPTLQQVELVPRLDYPFPSGTTGVMGRLVMNESANPMVSVGGAQVTLQVLIDGAWKRSRLSAISNSQGDFVSTLRLKSETGQSDDDPLPASLQFRIEIQLNSVVRVSREWNQSLGTLVTPTVSTPQLFAWNSMS